MLDAISDSQIGPICETDRSESRCVRYRIRQSDRPYVKLIGQKVAVLDNRSGLCKLVGISLW